MRLRLPDTLITRILSLHIKEFEVPIPNNGRLFGPARYHAIPVSKHNLDGIWTIGKKEHWGERARFDADIGHRRHDRVRDWDSTARLSQCIPLAPDSLQPATCCLFFYIVELQEVNVASAASSDQLCVADAFMQTGVWHDQAYPPTLADSAHIVSHEHFSLVCPWCLLHRSYYASP